VSAPPLPPLALVMSSRRHRWIPVDVNDALTPAWRRENYLCVKCRLRRFELEDLLIDEHGVPQWPHWPVCPGSEGPTW
jgi:hypothetical protein